MIGKAQPKTYRPIRALGGRGSNRPVVAEDVNRDQVIFKHNQYGERGKLNAQEAASRDRHEVMGNAILKKFGLPALPTEEALLEDGQGQRTKGVAAPFIQGLQTLEQVDVGAIKQPDVAVEQCILKGWMGDADSANNDSNVWILADGTPLAASDFGYSFREGVENVFGVPRANLSVMKAYAGPENVEPILQKIRDLSDGEITSMVEEIGQSHIADWNAGLGEQYSKILLNNRDRLRASNPYETFYRKGNATLGQRLRRVAIFLSPILSHPLALGAIALQTFHQSSGGRGL